MVSSTTPGGVVLVTFPFSDPSDTKLRPAVVLADAGRGDWILCQITSNPYADPRAVELAETDFQTGSLSVTSYARPVKLFTANRRLITVQVGRLPNSSFTRVLEAVISVFASEMAS